jgi:hypothetical protein
VGSTILAESAMRKARDRLGAELFFVIFRHNVGSLDLVGTISPANIFTIRDTSLFHLAWDSLAFLIWTRRKGIDTVVDLELFSRFTALLVGLSGASRRVGFYRFHNEGLYRGEMLTHRVAYNPHIHVAKNFVALVGCTLGRNANGSLKDADRRQANRTAGHSPGCRRARGGARPGPPVDGLRSGDAAPGVDQSERE